MVMLQGSFGGGAVIAAILGIAIVVAIPAVSVSLYNREKKKQKAIDKPDNEAWLVLKSALMGIAIVIAMLYIFFKILEILTD
jgi:hypothetical protein